MEIHVESCAEMGKLRGRIARVLRQPMLPLTLPPAMEPGTLACGSTMPALAAFLAHTAHCGRYCATTFTEELDHELDHVRPDCCRFRGNHTHRRSTNATAAAASATCHAGQTAARPCAVPRRAGEGGCPKSGKR